MIGEQIRQRLHARPFAPFRVRTANGQAVLIVGPDRAMVSPNARSMVGYDAAAELFIIDTDTITAVEAAPAGG